jgi:hypothetical protein
MAWLTRIKPRIGDSDARARIEHIVRRYVQLRYAQSVPDTRQIAILSGEIREFSLAGKVRQSESQVRTDFDESA